MLSVLCELLFESFCLSVQRFRPRALIREANVVGFMPSNSAAPRGPEILPLARAKAAMMLSRSRRLSSASGQNDRVRSRHGRREVNWFPDFEWSRRRKSKWSDAPLRAKIAARSMAFWSSRAFPGQSEACNRSMLPLVGVFTRPCAFNRAGPLGGLRTKRNFRLEQRSWHRGRIVSPDWLVRGLGEFL